MISEVRYLQGSYKKMVKNYYLDRQKLIEQKTTQSINIPFALKVGTKIYPHWVFLDNKRL